MDSVKSLHTFSLQAQCRKIINIDSPSCLLATIIDLSKPPASKEYLMLGDGSNTIFIEDYPFPVLLNRIKGIEISEDEDHYFLKVGSGVNWHTLVELCMKQGMGGFENLALIPGTVGASPIQNIGAYGVEIERFVSKVEFLDTTTLTISSINHEQCKFAYRDSIFKQQRKNHRIITHVFYRLPKIYTLETSYGPLSRLKSPTAIGVFNAVIAIRQSKLPDPAKQGNAGSFFKNPVLSKAHYNELLSTYNDMPCFTVSKEQVKVPAAWLIDFLGFKGKRIGDIACHVNQPLVLVNLGSGLGSDLLIMARDIRNAVQQTFAIHLDHEVRLVGRQGQITL